MTIEEWAKDFKSYVNALDMQRDDYKGIMEYIDDAIVLLKDHKAVPVYEDKNNKCECGEVVCRYWHPKFCGFCGKQLLWY